MHTSKKANKDTFVNTRVDKTTKEAVEEVLNKIGLSPADAVRLLFAQIILQKGLPFPVKIPNEDTIHAMNDIETGKVRSVKRGRDILKVSANLTPSSKLVYDSI